MDDMPSIEEMQDAFDATFPGLTMIVRDANLAPALTGQYTPRQIVRERGFTDATQRVGGMVTTHRYAILSNHFADLAEMEHDTNWGLCVINKDAHFKVLGSHRHESKTMTVLLHLPDDDRWRLFQNMTSNVEEELFDTCVERFEAKVDLAPIPEVVTEGWFARCTWPLGMSDEGELFPLEDEI